MSQRQRQSSSQPKFKHRFPHKGVLPEGHYYSLNWGIAYKYGGMTTVTLDRSSAFARHDNRKVEILTLSPAMKTQERDKELHADGRIDQRVRIRNLWKDLTAWSDRKLRNIVGISKVDDNAFQDVLPRGSDTWSEFRKSDSGAVLQVDRYREDGSLLLIDRMDVAARDRRSGRQITLFDRRQKVIAQWKTARSFYQAWLDLVIAGKRSYLISDSSFTGALIHDYRRDNVVLGQVMHNPFLRYPSGGIFGELPSGKFEFLRNLDSFDFVTTLTDQQRREMNDANLSGGNLRVVSNSTEDLNGDLSTPRNPAHGGMIARLVRQKRVEDAVIAIGAAVKRNPDIVLHIYGEGADRTMLTEITESFEITESVRFHGYTSGAKSQFRELSFSVLTSRFEGQGLVILESMSAGCIPIAYDIPYGPADIIQDGVNGFIVPGGDVDKLAAAIARVANMKEGELHTMRRAAMARSADFHEEPIVQRWGEVLSEQSFAPIVRLQALRGNLTSAISTDNTVDVAVSLEGTGGIKPDRVFVSWQRRSGSYFGRISASIEGEILLASIPIERLGSFPAGLVDFSVDFIVGRSFNRARIRSATAKVINLGQKIYMYSTVHGNLSGKVGELSRR